MSIDPNLPRSWKRDLIAVCLMAFASFVVETTLGLVLQPILVKLFGPLTGGLVSAIPDAIIVFLGIYLVPRLGSPTLFATLLLFLSSVTTSFGPPGLYKVAIGIGLGVTLDLWLLIFGRKKFSYILAVAFGFALSIWATYLAWGLFNVNQGKQLQDALRPHLWFLTVIYFLLGLVGASIGAWFFEKRLRRFSAIQELRGETSGIIGQSDQ